VVVGAWLARWMFDAAGISLWLWTPKAMLRGDEWP